MMSRWLASLIVRFSAWLAPRALRARWREEWLAEIEAAKTDAGRRFSRRPGAVFARALGAPWDALAARRLPRERATRGRLHLGQWRTDLRYTARMLARSPGYVATVVLGLGAGLTATIAMFSAVNTMLHGEIPGIADRDSLVRVRAEYADATGSRRLATATFSTETFEILRRHGALIADVAGQGRLKTSVRINGEPVSVGGAFASDTLFEMLGTRPAAGRLLTPSDDRSDADVVVIGYRFWQTHFGGRPDAVGRTMVVGDRVRRIVGVTPDQFRGLWAGPVVEAQGAVPPEIWLPLAAARTWSGTEGVDNPLGSHLDVAARVAPGATRARAATEFGAAARALEARDPTVGRAEIRIEALVLGAIADQPLEVAVMYVVLLGMPLALLAIGCANVANLRLARATARTQELAVRISLGATRGQLVRLLLAESTMLTTLALFVSGVAARALIVLTGPSFVAFPIHMDGRVAGFAAGLAAGVIFISGFAPGWLVTRRATAHGLKQTSQAGGVAHARLRHVLVVAQIALSLGLLAFGSLLMRSLLALNHTEPAGFDRLLVANVDLGAVGDDAPRARQFAATLVSRLQADSRFTGAGLAEYTLFREFDIGLTATAAGRTASRSAGHNRVTPGWFDAMDLRPLAGRVLRAGDRDVAVINESAAHALAAAGPPVGLQVSLSDSRGTPSGAVTIVGVVPNTGRDRVKPLEPRPFIYLPFDDAKTLSPFLYVREAAAADLSRELAGIITGVDTRAPWVRVRRASDLFDENTGDVRTLARAVTALALTALGLAAAGLFAVMAYTVSLRTREIGIRVALGARREDITRLVLRQALRLATIGAGLGFGIAFLLATALQSALLGLSPFDPLALLPVAVLLVVTTLAAGALPARRAAAIDPVVALRAE